MHFDTKSDFLQWCIYYAFKNGKHLKVKQGSKYLYSHQKWFSPSVVNIYLWTKESYVLASIVMYRKQIFQDA